jgi:hypothetical protein
METFWRLKDAAALAELAGFLWHGPASQGDYWALLGTYDRETIGGGMKRCAHMFASLLDGQQPPLDMLLVSIDAVVQAR